jgi:hypothetical protein
MDRGRCFGPAIRRQLRRWLSARAQNRVN